MKALSVRQPWAWLIANGHQDIENRSWQPKEPPGRILIHASSVPIRQFELEGFKRSLLQHGIVIPDDLQYGSLVGEAEVTEFTHDPNYPSIWRNYEHGPIGWILANADPIQPITYRGKLGLFDVDYDELLRRKVYASKIGS